MDPAASADVTSAVAALWERARAAMMTRVAVQERAVVAVLGASLDDATRALAARGAHALAGGLGTYGFTEASEAARQLEEVWQSEAPLRPTDAAGLAAVVRELRQTLPPESGAETPVQLLTAEPFDPADGGRDVLVVDDDETVGPFVKSALDGRGYTTRCVADGRAAVDTISNPATRPRLVLLDIDMPGENGFRVLRRLRLSGVLHDTRVVMLTARASSAEVQQAAALGVVDYLVKPLSIPLLVERVDRVLAVTAGA